MPPGTARSRSIQKAVDSGQIRQFTGNDYSGPLAKGDLNACFAWSGDVVQLEADNKHLHWNLPTDGGGIWTDNMLIPKGGNVYTASVYMNYYYDPKVAAAVEDYVNYICPVVGAKAVLLKKDPAIAKNTLIFPTKEMLANAHNFDAAALNNEKYITAWQNLISVEVGQRRGISPSSPESHAVPSARARAPLPRAVLHRPARLPRLPVTRVGELRRRLRLHMGVGQLLGCDPELPRSLHSLARVRRDRDDPGTSSSATHSRTGSRFAVGAGRTCCSCSSLRPSSSRI